MLNYYRDEPSIPLYSNSESFKCKTSITGNTYDGDDANKVGKNRSCYSAKTFKRFLKKFKLINCEIELNLA